MIERQWLSRALTMGDSIYISINNHLASGPNRRVVQFCACQSGELRGCIGCIGCIGGIGGIGSSDES